MAAVLRQIMFQSPVQRVSSFTPRGGEILLSARIVGEDVQIAVADNGPGISPELKSQCVSNAFSAKSQSRPARRARVLAWRWSNRFLETA
jgi:K+-sensing histidine kinase KdpD